MAALTTFAGGAHFNGPLSSNSFNPPPGSIRNAAIAQVTGDEIDYDKLEHLFPIVYRPANRQQRLTMRGERLDLTSASGLAGVLFVPQQAITIQEARIVYDDGNTDTVSDGTLALGTAAGGGQVFAATNFENSKAPGSETAVTLVDATHAAGTVLYYTYLGPASGVLGAAHLELDYFIDGAADEPVSESPIVHIARKAGTVVALQMVMDDVPSGAGSVTIDLKKSTGAAAFASILASTVVLDSSSVDRVAEAATVNSPDYVAGDLLQLSIAVAGVVGTEGSGLAIVLWCKEKP